jgi:DNA polymerase-1
MPRVFLIDGSSQMYRAYHAIRGLTGPDGRSTNAVYGFTTMLRKLIADHRPEYLAASFDVAGPTFRDDLAADYKANRTPMPGDLAEQVPLVRQACEAMGVPVLTFEGFEADDVIGTLARQARERGFDVALVTGDKDFFQLVQDGIRVYNPRDEGAWFDAAGVLEKFGVRPDQVIDVLALMGDSVDNIKGVPGIGEKGARDLIATHGTLESLIAAAPALTQKRQREALLANVESARASRELARIRTDVPVTFDPEAVRYRGPSRDKCFALFSSLGFRTLVAEFAPTAQTLARDYAVAGSMEDVTALARALAAADRIGIAAIATGSSALSARIVGWAFSATPGSARYVPLGHAGLTETPNLPARDVFAALGPVLADERIAKVGQDLKFAALAAAREGVTLAGLDVDTAVASYLLDATRSSHDIQGLALERSSYRAVGDDEVVGKVTKRAAETAGWADAGNGKGVAAPDAPASKRAIPLESVPALSLLTYAAEHADLPLSLAPGLMADLSSHGLDGVYNDLERPLIPVLASLEEAGIKIDVPALEALASSM